MYEVVLTKRAASQIERAAEWWEANRSSALGAIADDFQDAKHLLSIQPGIGSLSATARYPSLRRLVLRRVRYHVYYEIRGSKVFILAFWHSNREQRPSL